MARSARSRTWSSVTLHRPSRLTRQHQRPAETGDQPAAAGPPASSGRASSPGLASADELVGRTLSWFAVAALAYRVAITPILVAGALGNLRTDIRHSLLAGLAVVLTGDLVLLVGVIMGRFRGLLRSTAFLAVDLAVAAGLNLWATSTLPHGTFLWTGRDIVWGYGLGVISFWTALRGARTGAAILAGGVALHVLMARLNHAVFDFDGRMTFVARIAWLALAFGLALVIVALARQGARAAVGEGLRAGREGERARRRGRRHARRAPTGDPSHRAAAGDRAARGPA